MIKKHLNEYGFSLVELALAAAIALILSAATVTIMPGVMSKMSLKANAYASCSVNHGNAAWNLINGTEPSQSVTVNGQTSAAYQCVAEQSIIASVNASR